MRTTARGTAQLVAMKAERVAIVPTPLSGTSSRRKLSRNNKDNRPVDFAAISISTLRYGLDAFFLAIDRYILPKIRDADQFYLMSDICTIGSTHLLGVLLRVTTVENVVVDAAGKQLLELSSFNYALPGMHCEDKMVKRWDIQEDADLSTCVPGKFSKSLLMSFIWHIFPSTARIH